MNMKNRIFATMLVALVLATFSVAAPSTGTPQMPRTLANDRFVYVTSYDGNEFNPQLLPEDRDAIARVQTAIRKWGKLIVVFRPQDADIILAVESRPSEDILAVYDAHRGDEQSGPSQTILWRVMGRAGLQTSEMPLFTQFQKAWDKIAN
jgi:hypothetical protein